MRLLSIAGLTCLLLASCGGVAETKDPAWLSSPGGPAAAGDAAPEPTEVWCDPGQGKATQQVLVVVTCPGRERGFAFPLEMSRCPTDGSYFSSPSIAVSGDSMDLKAWSNGYVTLSDTTEDAAILEMEVSWHDADGGEGECRGSGRVRLLEASRLATADGVIIATRPGPGNERSNNSSRSSAPWRPA